MTKREKKEIKKVAKRFEILSVFNMDKEELINEINFDTEVSKEIIKKYIEKWA